MLKENLAYSMKDEFFKKIVFNLFDEVYKNRDSSLNLYKDQDKKIFYSYLREEEEEKNRKLRLSKVITYFPIFSTRGAVINRGPEFHLRMLDYKKDNVKLTLDLILFVDTHNQEFGHVSSMRLEVKGIDSDPIPNLPEEILELHREYVKLYPDKVNPEKKMGTIKDDMLAFMLGTK